MNTHAFKEFARQKLYEFKHSPTQTFRVLDEDRDGLIVPADIAQFLMRYHVKSSYLSNHEIANWFTGVCAGDATKGITMAEFCCFL